MKSIAIHVVIFLVLNLNDQNQRIIDNIIVAEIIQSRSQMFQDIIFAKNGLGISIDQKIHIQRNNWPFRKSTIN